MGYRIDVVTESVPEAIRHVGGFIFDRGRAGWRVVVVTDDVAHRRALTILGAVIESPGLGDGVGTTDPHVRISASVVGGGTALGDPAQHLLWGRPAPETTGRLHPVRHHLSAAARTFKAQALYCTGLTATVEPWESFWADEPTGVGMHLSGSVC